MEQDRHHRLVMRLTSVNQSLDELLFTRPVSRGILKEVIVSNKLVNISASSSSGCAIEQSPHDAHDVTKQ